MNDAPGGAEASHHFERHHSLEYVSLREYFERLLTDQHRYFKQHLEDRDHRYDERFHAQEKAVLAALKTVTEANTKFETQEAEWRRNANEWRDAMKDREKEFLGRVEAIEKFDRMAEKLDSLEQRFIRTEGKGAGSTATWAIVVTVVTVLVSVIGVVIVIVTR